MKPRLILLAALISSTALAQPTPGFSRVTTFEYSSKSWAFACGMHDAQGRTFGTAKEMTITTRWTFRPDGTYATTGMGAEHGRYRVIGKTVRVTAVNDDGSLGTAIDLALSPDGSRLGDMKRL